MHKSSPPKLNGAITQRGLTADEMGFGSCTAAMTLSIDTEAEINDARRALGVRRIALEARKASDEGLLPVGNHWSQLPATLGLWQS